MSDSLQNVGGAWIPPRIFHNKDLSAALKITLGRIFTLSRKEGYCWATDSTLAKSMGVNRRTIQRRLRKLEDKEYIVKTKDESGDNTKRRIYPTRKILHNLETDPSQGGGGLTTNPSQAISSKDTVSSKDINNKGDSRNDEVDWQNLTPPQRLAKSSPNRPCPRIAEVFQYVREARAEAVEKQVGPPLQLTTKRHNKIRARLKEGWEAEHLKHAYEGCLNDEWHAEKEKFDIEYVFRDDEKVRDFLRRYEKQGESQSNLIESDKERYLN